MVDIGGYIFNWWALLLVASLICIRQVLRRLGGMCKSTRRLEGKTVIVTGSNTGIGKEAAKDFAQRGARVILACRDLKKACQAREDIVTSTGCQQVVVRHLDLSSLSSVRQFARETLATEARLDVLVNNAGSAMTGQTRTEDGLLLGMQVNHFGPFLLTNLLLGLLKRSAPSRVVFVSSRALRRATFDVEDLNFDRPFDLWINFQVYSCSKLANVLTSNELARKLAGTVGGREVNFKSRGTRQEEFDNSLNHKFADGVTVNSLEPGIIPTGIWREAPFWTVPFIIARLAFDSQTVKQGAQTTIYLAVSEEVEGVTGRHFSECKEAMHLMSRMALDEGLAKKLWEKSEHFVQLRAEDVLY